MYSRIMMYLYQYNTRRCCDEPERAANFIQNAHMQVTHILTMQLFIKTDYYMATWAWAKLHTQTMSQQESLLFMSDQARRLQLPEANLAIVRSAFCHLQPALSHDCPTHNIDLSENKLFCVLPTYSQLESSSLSLFYMLMLQSGSSPSCSFSSFTI